MTQGQPPELVRFFADLVLTANRVCEVSDSRQRLGTGFLIGPDLVMTACHVARSADDPAHLRCIFSNILSGGVFVSSTIVSVMRIDAENRSELDFALLRLDRAVAQDRSGADSNRGYFDLSMVAGFGEGDDIEVIAFPNTDGISFTAGKVVTFDRVRGDVTFLHSARTFPHCSGAPILDNQFNVVGLHRGVSRNGGEGIDLSRINAELRR